MSFSRALYLRRKALEGVNSVFLTERPEKGQLYRECKCMSGIAFGRVREKDRERERERKRQDDHRSSPSRCVYGWAGDDEGALSGGRMDENRRESARQCCLGGRLGVDSRFKVDGMDGQRAGVTTPTERQIALVRPATRTLIVGI
jgi:hypothetical protein